jgi:hypothetical protein
MPSKRKQIESVERTVRPARDLENRESQLIEMAYNLAEERLLNKTASAQEIVHFLRMGTAKSQLEKKKLEAETELLSSKKEAIDSSKRSDEMYQEAIDAFKMYGGQSDVVG